MANIISFFGKDRDTNGKTMDGNFQRLNSNIVPVHPANRLINFSGVNPDMPRCPKGGISYNEYKVRGDNKKPIIRKNATI